MRQFGLYQEVPPPAPERWTWHQCYDKIKHKSSRASNTPRDWGVIHKMWLDTPMLFTEEDRPWFIGPHNEYSQWYMLRGMPTVYIIADDDQMLEQPHQDPAQNEVGSLPYQARGYRHARLLYRMIRLTAQGIQWVNTPGQMAFGKQTLKMAEGAMDELGRGQLFRAMVRVASLPEDP